VRILTEPKNSLVKQYRKLFELESVDLKFTEAALLAVAKDALKRSPEPVPAVDLGEHHAGNHVRFPCMTGVRECVVGEEVVAE